ncbi:type IV pilus biogenesis complex ATPase subunit [Natronomonas pharaonis DSM 2160]|uniref:Type IV pilus biogenesis complex ATPase subunit n=1 Tax=Natronomonas pharaonis (strain ATCC 35678 / DSM 2160 / CIP 103997 / JCM 8858 / NBRC 14720 / NCIMB 2260 / Gabara) TaxID=348780 RepID=A0A1U7EZE6_NATPD|nr:ATPase, T2SS/T4P/T4SS family [Natronomonas pharaonis]CAI50693.1 type IV pilus biogenesis complex ATPase subunit [Natronomonas pharaonis DSM 2160]
MLDRLFPTDADCRCRTRFDGDRLCVESDDCPGSGRLATEPACRRTAIEALESRDAEVVLTASAGFERAYEGTASALLVAAGRFADAMGYHDEELAVRARSDPLGAARTASGRGGRLARAVVDTGLEAFVGGDYETLLRPHVGPSLARSRVATRPPPAATLRTRYELDTGAVVRRYADDGLDTYHLTPAEHRLDESATATLDAAYQALARGAVSGGERAASRAVRSVADDEDPVGTLVSVLEKHTGGLGVLTDCFADPAVSDVFATAPVAENRLRLRHDGETLRTNVRMTAAGADALASQFRRSSGRAFSQASPTLDATADAGGRRVRVAGVTDPVSDGTGFTFRAHDESSFSLADLVENGTLTPVSAGFLSVAAERGASLLLAGARGAGKTTLLGALLWEIPPDVRTVAIEDTPELPVSELQSAGRDVQPLRVTEGDGASITATAALRTALRLGDGALVVGEVRGEEAQVLYEAMRVGAADGTVLGTIHGGGGESVRERVVTDLGVPVSAFADTDFVVTVEAYDDSDERARRINAIEAVRRHDEGVGFEHVGGVGVDGMQLTDAAVSPLCRPTEHTDEVRAVVHRRADSFQG